MTKTSITICITTFFIICLVSSCFPESLVWDESCEPPCWHHIIPGISSRADVKIILPTILGVKRSHDFSCVMPNDCIKWFAPFLSKDVSGYIFFNNDTVVDISFSFYKNAISLEEAIQKFGEPDQYLGFYLREEVPYVVIYVIYRQKGILLSLGKKSFSFGDKVELTPKSHIISIDYFYPPLFNDLMTEGQLARINIKRYKDDIQPWKGYGEIEYVIQY